MAVSLQVTWVVNLAPASASEVTTLWRCTNAFTIIIIIIIIIIILGGRFMRQISCFLRVSCPGAINRPPGPERFLSEQLLFVTDSEIDLLHHRQALHYISRASSRQYNAIARAPGRLAPTALSRSRVVKFSRDDVVTRSAHDKSVRLCIHWSRRQIRVCHAAVSRCHSHFTIRAESRYFCGDSYVRWRFNVHRESKKQDT